MANNIQIQNGSIVFNFGNETGVLPIRDLLAEVGRVGLMAMAMPANAEVAAAVAVEAPEAVDTRAKRFRTNVLEKANYGSNISEKIVREVYSYLRSTPSRNRYTLQTYGEIAAQSGYSQTTVARALQEIERRGFLHIKAYGRTRKLRLSPLKMK